MATGRITVSIKDVPEVIAQIRHEVAELLRSASEGCRSTTAKTEIQRAADAVEMGLRRVEARDWT